MAREIQRHSTRLSQVHEAAQDLVFTVGQRVQTIDGHPGRILFVSDSFAPGVTEYQVQLEGGRGEGTYTASQLRPIPGDYRGATQPLPPDLLPAGVRPMASYITEDQARQRWHDSPEAQAGMTAEEVLRAQAAEVHLASDDYPEMGEVLHDRPDPGTVIKVIGRKTAAIDFGPPGDQPGYRFRGECEYCDFEDELTHFPRTGLNVCDQCYRVHKDAIDKAEAGHRHQAADTYRDREDPRDGDYNGGPNDVGAYWAQPGQQDWMHENIGPQEEAPPPLMMAPEPEDLPGPLARLAQIEEAGTLLGGTRHYATTINGTQIDDAGDAPEHGTVPRASEPNSYDARSTEGQGDPKWDDPVSGDADKKTLNGATVGMYPEGVEAGGGPGMEIGAFVANVPWTGEQRTHLHSWDNGGSAQPGDFVSSHNFTNKIPLVQEVEDPAQEIIEQDLRAQAASQHDWAAHLQQRHGYSAAHIARMLADGKKPGDLHQAIHDAGLADHEHSITYDTPYPPVPPESGGLLPDDPEHAVTDSSPGRVTDPAEWSEMTRRRHLSAQAGVRVKVHGPDDFTLHQAPDEHQDDANDLDTPADTGQDTEADTEADKNSLDYGNPQVSAPADQDDSLDAPAGDPGDQPGTVPTAPDPNASLTGPDAETEKGRGLPPTAWPMTQAPIQQGGPAYTQGTHDQHGRVFPPPPPAPAPTGEDGEPLGEDGEGEPGEEGDGKKVQLEIKTGATEEALEDRFGPEAHPTRRNRAVRPESGGAASPDPEHSVTDSEPVHGKEDDELTWEERARRYSALALTHFTAAAGDPAFRFEFTASWKDVVAKAKRLRKAGRVRITHSSRGMVIGEVGGDHDVYETGIQRVAGKPQTIQHWACGCPWGSFRQNKIAARMSRLNGRPCSHVMALQFEALSRTRRYDKVDQDLSAAELGVPHQVVVKSLPPWGPGGWAQTWIAPAASLRTAAPGDADWREPEDPRQHLHDEHGIPHEWLSHMTHEDLVRRHKFKHQQDEWETGSQPGHDHHLFGQEFNPYGESSDYIPDYHGGHNQNPRRPDLDREFHRYQDIGELVNESAPWQGTPDYRAKQHLSRLSNVNCYYHHHGECPDPGRTAESSRHSRPGDYYSEIAPNKLFDPGSQMPTKTATHVMTGYLGGKPAGRLHFSQSDDGQAFEVHMMHSLAPHQGVGSAMMDDLYSHVKANGRWLDHGMRTAEGHHWWASYREPYPEINTHHTHPDEGWRKYWSPLRVGMDSEENRDEALDRYNAGGTHTPLPYNPRSQVHDDHPENWTHARGLLPPAQQATAALLAAGADLGDVIALAQLAGFRVTADQTNAPWGSENVTKHPPQKPYGATEPPNPDQSPASYGFLSAPDPDNWGSIQEDSAMQMPLTNTAARVQDYTPPGHEGHGGQVAWLTHDWDELPRCTGCGHRVIHPETGVAPQETRSSGPKAIMMEMPNRQRAKMALSSPEHKVLAPGAPNPLPAGLNYPSIADQDNQGTFSYTDQAPAAGPSTAMEPRDPQGIRMEESLDPAADAEEYRRHLVEMHGQPDVDWLPQDYAKHARDHEDAIRARELGEPLEVYTGYRPHPYKELDHEYRYTRGRWPDAMHSEAELHDEPEPALPSTTGDDEDFQDRGEQGRQAAGIDGTAGDAQDVPHGFENDLADGCGGCKLCGLSPDAAVHHTASAMGDQSVAEGLTGGAQLPSPVTQEPGMGSQDEYLTPQDPSIQTIGQQQWSGGGADSDEEAVEPGQPQGGMDDIVAAFQRSAAARQYGGGTTSHGAAGGPGDGDIARAAQAFLKTSDVLPDHEADELIREGRGERARNLGLLRLEGTHYEDEDTDLARRGLSLDDYEDDVISA